MSFSRILLGQFLSDFKSLLNFHPGLRGDLPVPRGAPLHRQGGDQRELPAAAALPLPRAHGPLVRALPAGADPHPARGELHPGAVVRAAEGGKVPGTGAGHRRAALLLQRDEGVLLRQGHEDDGRRVGVHQEKVPEQVEGAAQAAGDGGDHGEADGVLQRVQQDVLPISREGLRMACGLDVEFITQ